MEFGLLILFVGGAIELLLNFVAIPMSMANLCLVTRTSVIHPNMKAILIFQSFVLLVRGLCRFIVCLFKFILWDPLSAEKMTFFPALGLFNFFGIYSRNFVPHILIVERILATLLIRSYGECRGFMFTMLWAPFVLAISIYIALTSSPRTDRPVTNLIMTGVQLVVGTIELVIFYQLCQYNSKCYQKMTQNKCSHSLSIRYQLSENIRIGKQLICPLSLNLCNILAGEFFLLCNFLDMPFEEQIHNFMSILGSFFGLLIELFIITSHPFLKRDLGKIVHRFGTMVGFNNSIHNNQRIGDETITAVGMINDFLPIGIAQINLINGKALISQSKPEEHFAMLRKAWEHPISR